jgi:hypothetical protein
VIKLGFPYREDGHGPRGQFVAGWDPAAFGKRFVGHLAVFAEINEVFAKIVVPDRLPDLLDNHMFHLLPWPIRHPTVFDDVRSRVRLTLRIRFDDPSSVAAHRVSSTIDVR